MKYPKYKFVFAYADYFIIFFSLLAADYITNSIGIGIVPYFQSNYWIILLYAVMCTPVLFIFQVNNLYQIDVILSFYSQIRLLLISLFISYLGILLVYYTLLSHDVSNSFQFIFRFILISLILILIFRIEILYNLFLKLAKSKVMRRRIVIVGAGKSGKTLAEKLLKDKRLGVEVIGFIDDSRKKYAKIVGNIEVLGNVDQIPFVVKNSKIEEVIIAIDNIGYDRLLDILDICEALHLNVKIRSQLFGIVNQKIKTEKYSDIPLIDAAPRYNIKYFLPLRRALDVVLSLSAIIILMPLFMVIIVLIMLSSPGNAFFKQIRIGKNGKPFSFYKFRTMRLASDDDAVRKKMMADFIKNDKVSGNGGTKIINNSRVTPIGKFLRKYSLDELPQLINVLIGEMSLVGPRPCLPYEYALFDEWQKRKFSVLPGCTGIWQVTGRSSVSFKDSVVLDIYYINNMTPWLDLSIILKTIPVMLFAKGGE
jgi:undecaprenyl-phosphate galactose phosphotransferase